MIAIPIILSSLITFVITKTVLYKHYINTIEYKNRLIDQYIEIEHKYNDLIK